MERRRKYIGHQPPKNSRFRVKVFNRQLSLPIKAASVRRFILFIFEKKRVVFEELSIYFVGKKKITDLHAKFFQDPTPTDCITFPIDSCFLGEIFVCPQVALEYAPTEPYEEVSLYILHGLLHLLGYNDKDKKERAQMRREERKLMAFSREQHCILESSL